MKLYVSSFGGYYISDRDNWYLRKNGTVQGTLKDGSDWFETKQQAQQFLDNWFPQKDWLTQGYVKEQAKISECAALDCSIEHYKQILLAGYDSFMEARNKGLAGIKDLFCAMCQRKNSLASILTSCKEYCLLNKEGQLCCNEWRDLKAIIISRKEKEFDKAVTAVLNKLIEIRSKHFGRKEMDKMIDVKGKKVSESTVVEALEKHCGFEEKKEYVPQAGHVVQSWKGEERFVIKLGCSGELATIDKSGAIISRSRGKFSGCNYKYLGKLNGFNWSGMDVFE